MWSICQPEGRDTARCDKDTRASSQLLSGPWWHDRVVNSCCFVCIPLDISFCLFSFSSLVLYFIYINWWWDQLHRNVVKYDRWKRTDFKLNEPIAKGRWMTSNAGQGWWKLESLVNAKSMQCTAVEWSKISWGTRTTKKPFWVVVRTAYCALHTVH